MQAFSAPPRVPNLCGAPRRPARNLVQLNFTDKVANSLALGTSPIVRSLFDPEGGMRDIRALDNISFTDWFKSHGGSQASVDRVWNPIIE